MIFCPMTVPMPGRVSSSFRLAVFRSTFAVDLEALVLSDLGLLDLWLEACAVAAVRAPSAASTSRAASNRGIQRSGGGTVTKRLVFMATFFLPEVGQPGHRTARESGPPGAPCQ